MHLRDLGWNSFFQVQWESKPRSSVQPARVVEEQRGGYRLVCEIGELSAEVTGQLRHAAVVRSAFPAVGDWVAVGVIAGEEKALIHEVLPRQTKLSRKVAGKRSIEQILVANVNTVLVVTSLNADLSPRRIERYLSTVWESGAQPVIVLSKADLCPDPRSIANDVAAITYGVGVHVLSAVTGEGLEELTPYIGPGQTVVLVGSSGVGKSTIINRLLDSDIQSTREIRASDGRGRQATTYRRLFLMPAGGVLIDTPGIRELQLWDSGGLDDAFDEIGELGSECRFRDCRHENEPGCAVQQAIAAGTLDPERLAGFQKLKRELEHLDRRRDLAAQAQQRKHWKQLTKALRRHYKEK